MKQTDLKGIVYDYYSELGTNQAFLDTGYLSKNVLRQMLFQRRSNMIFGEVISIIEENHVVLDIGCGGGWYLKEIAERCKAIGIDISQGYLEQANRFLQGKMLFSLIHGDASHLPLKDKCIDVILATEIIEHAISPSEVIEEIKRVLKDGGKAVITVPSILNYLEWSEKSKKKIRGSFNSHLHFYTPRSARKFIEKSGFDIIRAKTGLFLPVPYQYFNISKRHNWIRKSYNAIEDIISRLPFMNLLGWTVVITAAKK